MDPPRIVRWKAVHRTVYGANDVLLVHVKKLALLPVHGRGNVGTPVQIGHTATLSCLTAKACTV